MFDFRTVIYSGVSAFVQNMNVSGDANVATAIQEHFDLGQAMNASFVLFHTLGKRNAGAVFLIIQTKKEQMPEKFMVLKIKVKSSNQRCLRFPNGIFLFCVVNVVVRF